MSATTIRRYRAAFEESGGRGAFHLFPDIGGNGHYLVNRPLFWPPAMDAYLQALSHRTAPKGERQQSSPRAREEGTR